MDWAEIKARWDEYRHRVLERWEELTDDQLDETEGDRDILIRKLEETYGIEAEEAEAQVRDFEEAL